MSCCQCQGLEELFDEDYVRGELADYHAKGPDETTRMLVDALRAAGVQGLSLLDIGGGLGAIQHELLTAGAERATNVEASRAYLDAARGEAQRRGLAERIHFEHGDFIDLAGGIAPADIVTLDRVICCYPDMVKLVGLSAARARRFYALVFPRDTWWIKFGLAVQNIYQKLRRSNYRAFAHSTKEVEEIVGSYGLRRHAYQRTMIWQVVVYRR